MAVLEADPLLRNVPPHSAEAERAVLGALLIDPSSIDEVAVLVLPEHMYKPAHALIYTTVLDLWRADKPVDVVLLNEELTRRGTLEQVGGTAVLAELTEAVPTAANAPYYAKIVRDHAGRRDLIRVTAEVQRDAFDTSSPTEELLDRTEKKLFEVTQQRIRSEAVPVATVVEEAFKRLKAIKDGQGVTGLPSGFVDVDELTQGFQPGEMTILAARPSMGKTSFCLNILRNVTVYQGRPAVFFSLEMPRLQVTSNILCSLAKIDGHRLRGGYLTREEERNFLDAAEVLAPAPLFIDDTPGLSTMELRAKVRRLKSQHDISFVVIDYLQLMSGSDRSAQESRQQEVSEISRMIKALARELSIPIMALAQLSRKVEERKDHKPMMSDLRESGCLAGDTLVTLADSGRRVPIRELEGKAGFDVWALNTGTLELERAPVSAAFCTGTKPVLRLTTALGRTIRATANHRFYTVEGWKRLDELSTGDRLALPLLTGGMSYCGSTLYRQSLGRERAARVAAVLESPPLAALATSDLYWDRVVSIEPDGEERVFDLTVPDLHSFVANDIVVHNSIEQDADVIMLLFRPEYYDPDKEELKNKAEVIVAKNRNGPVGEVKMAFFNSHMRFESLTRM